MNKEVDRRQKLDNYSVMSILDTAKRVLGLTALVTTVGAAERASASVEDTIPTNPGAVELSTNPSNLEAELGKLGLSLGSDRGEVEQSEPEEIADAEPSVQEQQEAPLMVLQITVNSGNLRSTPGIENNVIGSVKQGDLFVVSDTRQDSNGEAWLYGRVGVDGEEGFISATLGQPVWFLRDGSIITTLTPEQLVELGLGNPVVTATPDNEQSTEGEPIAVPAREPPVDPEANATEAGKDTSQGSTIETSTATEVPSVSIDFIYPADDERFIPLGTLTPEDVPNLAYAQYLYPETVRYFSEQGVNPEEIRLVSGIVIPYEDGSIVRKDNGLWFITVGVPSSVVGGEDGLPESVQISNKREVVIGSDEAFELTINGTYLNPEAVEEFLDFKASRQAPLQVITVLVPGLMDQYLGNNGTNQYEFVEIPGLVYASAPFFGSEEESANTVDGWMIE